MSHNYKLKSVLFTQIEDIRELQRAGYIGRELKPGIMHGAVIVFRGAEGSGAVSVRLYGREIHARLLAPTRVPEQTTRDIIQGAAYTLYKSRALVINTEPLYSAEEVSCRQ